MTTVDISEFSKLPPPQLEEFFLTLCSSPVWAHQLSSHAPWDSYEDIAADSDKIFETLSWDQIRVGLHNHPRIGERSLSQQSSTEQKGIFSSATAAQQQELVDLNEEYEEKFGHVFLIFASDKTADQVIEELKKRTGLSSDREQPIVASQLQRITHHRLAQLAQRTP